MSIHKRGDGWQVKWRHGTKQRSRTFTRKADARRFQAEVVRRKELGPALARELDRTSMTLAQYVEGPWRNHSVNLSLATQDGYKWALENHLAPFLDEPLVGLDIPALAAHQRRMLDKGATPTTIREVMVRLSGICQLAVEHGVIPSNPVRGLRRPRPEAGEEVVAMTPIEVERLIASLDGRDKVIVLLGAHLGLRPLELRAVRWGALADRTLTVGKADTKATARKTRVIAVPQITATELKQWRLQSGRPGPKEPIIGPLTANGMKLWGSRRLRPKVALATDGRIPEATVYSLRHTHASLCHYAGMTVPEAARRLGHGGEMHLRCYAHVIDALGSERWPDLDAMIAASRPSLMFPKCSPESAEGRSDAP